MEEEDADGGQCNKSNSCCSDSGGGEEGRGLTYIYDVRTKFIKIVDKQILRTERREGIKKFCGRHI